jgi:hypothetical protein
VVILPQKEREKMEVQILNTISDYRVLDKQYTPIAITQCEPFGELDIDTPVLRIKPFTNFASANAFYIPDFLRYYIITKVKRLSGNIIEVSGRIDVLATFKNVIRQCKGVCVANENVGASHVVDNNYPLDVRKITECYEFEGEPFNTETASDESYNFVLNVAGGGASE